MRAFKKGEEDHTKRLNKVLQYIKDHLEEELSLEKIAAIACYSPFHFHRIFRSFINESLNVYIVRKRIEKAASILMRKPNVSITELSIMYGFNGNTSFSRAFKKYYGMSPSDFRAQAPGRHSKLCLEERKNGKGKTLFEPYFWDMDNHIKWMEARALVEIKTLPQLELAYIAHIGDQGQAQTFQKLMEWAGQAGLLQNPDFTLLKIYHDSFRITASEQVRMSACIVLKEPVSTDVLVGTMTMPSGKCVVARMELAAEEFGKAWTELFVWLNHNGYKTTERNCFEIYRNDPAIHPEQHFIVDLCIPIDIHAPAMHTYDFQDVLRG